MPRNGPEKEGESRNAKSHEDRHPNGTTQKQLFDVWLTDAQGAERCRFTLPEKDEDGVQFVLM